MAEMQETVGLRETRLQQARDLRLLVGQSGLQAATDTPCIETIRDRRFNGAYGLMAERLFYGLGERANATGNERLIGLAEGINVLNGCYVTGKILSYGPKAYLRFLAEKPEPTEPSVDELGGIMKRSKKIVRLFSDLTQRDNTTYEINFGLHQYPPVHEEVPFLIAHDESGELLFSESPITLMRTKLEVASRNLNEGVSNLPNGIHCPASGKVLDAIWSAGVEVCVQDPDLYAHDISKSL